MKKIHQILMLCLLLSALPGIAHAQKPLARPADAFFQKVMKANPDHFFPLSEENGMRYKEMISGGEFVTQQAFKLYDPYATGKARYAKTLAQDALKKYFPATTFLAGELSCNMEFNGGKLPFVGYVNAQEAGYFVHPGYDLLDAQTLKLLGRPVLKSKSAKENYANALLELFAGLRLRPSTCNVEIVLGKGKFEWAGETLNARMTYTSECEINSQRGEWGPREFSIAVDFEFGGDQLENITVISWP